MPLSNTPSHNPLNQQDVTRRVTKLPPNCRQKVVHPTFRCLFNSHPKAYSNHHAKYIESKAIALHHKHRILDRLIRVHNRPAHLSGRCSGRSTADHRFVFDSIRRECSGFRVRIRGRLSGGDNRQSVSGTAWKACIRLANVYCICISTCNHHRFGRTGSNDSLTSRNQANDTRIGKQGYSATEVHERRESLSCSKCPIRVLGCTEQRCQGSTIARERRHTLLPVASSRCPTKRTLARSRALLQTCMGKPSLGSTRECFGGIGQRAKPTREKRTQPIKIAMIRRPELT